jgi:hypothetical protein
MALMVVRHEVKDYDAWRAVYDEVEHVKRSGGVIEEAVYRADEHSNTVLVLHHFDTMEEAKAYAAHEALADAMDRAGAIGEPRFEFYVDA